MNALLGDERNKLEEDLREVCEEETNLHDSAPSPAPVHISPLEEKQKISVRPQEHVHQTSYFSVPQNTKRGSI